MHEAQPEVGGGDVVVIGVDPHKASVTLEARDTREILRASGTFPTTTPGYRAMIQVARQWPRRIWAVEGARGVGRALVARLLAGGERVVDVPAKLSARTRVFDTGHGRKTDAHDAHAIVMVALRDHRLREVVIDEDLEVLRLLVDRRDELAAARTQALNRAHRLFAELVPGGAPTKKSVTQYQALLTGIRPRDGAGRVRRRTLAEELTEARRLEVRVKEITAEIKAAVLARGSHLMDLPGIGPAGAGRILADAGNVARFPSRHHFASWTGTAPIDASSGAHQRHRLPIAAALREIRRAKAEHAADAAQRSRIGQVEDEATRAEVEDLVRREQELVAGHGDLRFSGLVTVTASTLDELDAACAATEAAAAQSLCEVRRLVGQQGLAHLAGAVPLARGVL